MSIVDGALQRKLERFIQLNREELSGLAELQSRRSGRLRSLWADHLEFSRTVPEKVAASSSADAVMLKRSDRAVRQLARFVSD